MTSILIPVLHRNPKRKLPTDGLLDVYDVRVPLVAKAKDGMYRNAPCTMASSETSPSACHARYQHWVATCERRDRSLP